MSESLIERVARAIYDTDHFSGPNYDSEPEPYKETFRVQARAAIEAMRELPDSIAAVVKPEPTHLYVGRDDWYRTMMEAATVFDQIAFQSDWQRAIDAAISGGRQMP